MEERRREEVMKGDSNGEKKLRKRYGEKEEERGGEGHWELNGDDFEMVWEEEEEEEEGEKKGGREGRRYRGRLEGREDKEKDETEKKK